MSARNFVTALIAALLTGCITPPEPIEARNTFHIDATPDAAWMAAVQVVAEDGGQISLIDRESQTIVFKRQFSDGFAWWADCGSYPYNRAWQDATATLILSGSTDVTVNMNYVIHAPSPWTGAIRDLTCFSNGRYEEHIAGKITELLARRG